MNRQFQASPGGRPLRGLFVSGTGTDVGKTVALAALLRACLKADLRVRPVKPVQTGVSGPDDARGDATVYAAAIAGLSNAVAPATLRRFVMPASPHLAAGREGVHLDVESLRAAVLQTVNTTLLRTGVKAIILLGYDNNGKKTVEKLL